MPDYKIKEMRNSIWLDFFVNEFGGLFLLDKEMAIILSGLLM